VDGNTLVPKAIAFAENARQETNLLEPLPLSVLHNCLTSIMIKLSLLGGLASVRSLFLCGKVGVGIILKGWGAIDHNRTMQIALLAI
jgi:hypothetical protein